MKITQKQDNFCLEYIKTGNASEAYRVAYDTKPTTKDETIWNSAYKLLSDPNVSARVKELKDKAEAKAIMTLEQRKELLSRFAWEEESDKAMKAMDLLNKIDGVYIQKNQTEHSGSLGVKFEIDLG